MIGFVRGVVDGVGDDYVILDVGGVGYIVHVGPATRARLSREGEVKLFTYTYVKDDGIALYGFPSMDEINMFNMLITVSGVGPKAAMALLNVMKPMEVTQALITGDVLALGKAQGIGKKTAQRLILELKDKCDSGLADDPAFDLTQTAPQGQHKRDALDALLALGYSRGEAMQAVLEVAREDMTAEEIIKGSLKTLSR